MTPRGRPAILILSFEIAASLLLCTSSVDIYPTSHVTSTGSLKADASSFRATRPSVAAVSSASRAREARHALVKTSNEPSQSKQRPRSSVQNDLKIAAILASSRPMTPYNRHQQEKVVCMYIREERQHIIEELSVFHTAVLQPHAACHRHVLAWVGHCCFDKSANSRLSFASQRMLGVDVHALLHGTYRQVSSGGPPPGRIDSLDKIASHSSHGNDVLAIRCHRGLHVSWASAGGRALEGSPNLKTRSPFVF